jgi:hypothetical protein
MFVSLSILNSLSQSPGPIGISNIEREISEEGFGTGRKVSPFGRTRENWGILDLANSDSTRKEFEGTLPGRYLMLDLNILQP